MSDQVWYLPCVYDTKMGKVTLDSHYIEHGEVIYVGTNDAGEVKKWNSGGDCLTRQSDWDLTRYIKGN